MASDTVLIRREPGVITAVINRADKLNALNKDVFDDLNHLLDVLETDKTARVLIITGTGEKAFSVGADLKERQGMNEKDILVRFDYVRALYLRLERLPMPVIAAINGAALGGGLELALACDLRVAAENATLGFPEVDLAIIPGNGGTQRLPRVVGVAKAMELILLGKRVSATEALSFRLINAVSPVGQSVAHAIVWANKMIESAPLALQQAKLAIRMGTQTTLEQGLSLETEAYRLCLYSKDRVEGLKAFSEKRKPIYRGE